MAAETELHKACKAAVTRFLKPERQGWGRNVVGAGLGYKNGKTSQGVCLRYYVERKIAGEAMIPPEYLLADPTGEGVVTDVEETGRLQGFGKAAPGSTLSLRLQAPNVTPMATGTLGGVVVRGKRKFLLTSNHALAFNGRVPLGTGVYVREWREFVTGEEPLVARLTEPHWLNRKADNQVDCALAEIADDSALRLGEAVAPAEPVLDGRVYKDTDRGRTQGRICDVEASVDVNFSFGTFRFTDVLLIASKDDRFAAPGDSGALVFERKSGRPVAMIIGGSTTHVVACKLSNVLAVTKGTLHLGKR